MEVKKVRVPTSTSITKLKEKKQKDCERNVIDVAREYSCQSTKTDEPVASAV